MKTERKFNPEDVDPIRVRMIPLELIEESPLNPRTTFAQQEHEELTQSMREHGFTLSAITVRQVEPGAVAAPIDPTSEDGQWRLVHPVTQEPYSLPSMSQIVAQTKAQTSHKYRYEVVAGARRRRAAKAAGLTEAPCIVREVSDLDLIKLALIENLQRKQLSAMEEANGYAAMRERGLSVEEIAKQIGRTPEHVGQTLQLCRLTGEAREALEAGVLPRKTAYLIGRIPDDTVRDRVAQEVLHPLTNEGPLPFRAAEDLVKRQYMRSLRNLPWSAEDAELVPAQVTEQGERFFGGACADCPFNTMNRAEERPEGGHRRSGECLNLACYDAKEGAVWEQFAERETDATQNRRALSREECRELFYPDGDLQWGTPFVELSAMPPAEALRPGVEAKPWKDLVKGSGIEVLVARDPLGRRRELLVASLAKTAAGENGFKIFKGDEREERREKEKMKDEEHKETVLREKAAKEKEAEYQVAYNAALRRELRAKVCALGYAPPVFWRVAARHELREVGVGEEVAKSRECAAAEDVSRWLESCTDEEALALFVELLVFADVTVPSHEKMEVAAKAFGVDCKAIEKRVRLEVEGPAEEAKPKARRKGRKAAEAAEPEAETAEQI